MRLLCLIVLTLCLIGCAGGDIGESGEKASAEPEVAEASAPIQVAEPPQPPEAPQPPEPEKHRVVMEVSYLTIEKRAVLATGVRAGIMPAKHGWFEEIDWLRSERTKILETSPFPIKYTQRLPASARRHQISKPGGALFQEQFLQAGPDGSIPPCRAQRARS